MERDEERYNYRAFVVDYLRRRHIQETFATLVWLRNQKTMSQEIKEIALEKVKMEIGVLDEMVVEADGAEDK